MHVEDLGEWAGLLSRLGEWLGYAGPETHEDWEGFFGTNRHSLDVVAVVLGKWSTTMRTLAECDG